MLSALVFLRDVLALIIEFFTSGKPNLQFGPAVLEISTGVLQLEKLSAGDASNRKPKYKR